MVSFSQARFGEVDPNIAISRVSAPADQSTAAAVEAFGNVGGQIREGLLKRDLKGELRETGNIIGTINAGEDAIRDAVQKGQIDPTTQKFQRLAAASEQGRISQQRAALEAEVLLRQSISLAPGFAGQLRKTARDTLGFDPTAGALNTLFLSGPDGDSTRVTQEMKDLEQADQLVATGYAASREEALRLVVGARAADFQAKIDSKRIRDGKLDSNRIAVMGAKRAQNGSNEFMLEAMKQIRQTGSIQDTEVLKNGMIAKREKIKAELEEDMVASEDHIYDEDAFNNMRNRVDEVFDASMEMLDNQDVLEVLSREQEKLESIVSLTGIALAPQLAVMAQFGDQAVSKWIELMAASNGDQQVMDELIKIDPEYRFLQGLNLDNNKLMPALKAAAEGALGQRTLTGEVDEQTGKAVARKEGLDLINGQRGREETDRIYTNLEDVGQRVTALSTLAETTDSFFHASPETRQKASQNFRVSQQQQVQNLSQRLAQNGMGLAWNGRRFVVQDPQDRNVVQISPSSQIGNTISSLGGPTPGGQAFRERTLASSAGVSEQLDFVNGTMLKLVKDRRWAKEFGFEDVNDWANSLMNTVNLNAAQTDLARGSDSAISQSISMADQAHLRTALEEGNIDQAIDVLTQAKFAGQEISGVQSSAQFESGPSVAGQGSVDRGQGVVTDQPAGAVAPINFSNQFHADVAVLEGLHTIEDFERTNTVGFGRDLKTNPLQPEDYQFIGLEPGASNQEVAQHLANNPEVARDLMVRDLDIARENLLQTSFKGPDGDQPIASVFNSLDNERQEILNNMAYQMGADGVAGFKDMLTELSQPDPDFFEVADAMLDSKWARQDSPRRARLLAARMAGVPLDRLVAAIRQQQG